MKHSDPGGGREGREGKGKSPITMKHSNGSGTRMEGYDMVVFNWEGCQVLSKLNGLLE